MDRSHVQPVDRLPKGRARWKGTGSMLMFRVGKSRSGRELDRQLHDGFMPAVESRERIPT